MYPFGETAIPQISIILGAGGHGWPKNSIITKYYPAGIASYSWINSGKEVNAFASFEKNKQVYIIEIQHLPSQYSKEYKVIFDQILSTFKFL